MKVEIKESLDDSNELLAIATSTVRQALKATFALHERLGAEGTVPVQTNEFGDVAMRGDIESEQVMIDALQRTGISIAVLSEEHGHLKINPEKGEVQLTAALDGLDGSEVYRTDRGEGRYGTMFAIFQGSNPQYSDYLAAGIMEHSTSRLALAVKQKGVEITDLTSGNSSLAHARQNSMLRRGATIIVDSDSNPTKSKFADYFNTNKRVFADPLTKAGFKTIRIGSSAAGNLMLVTNEIECVCESTRKGSLEFATGYAIIREAGGVVVTLDGVDLGSKRFLTFGKDTHEPVLMATNPNVARQVLKIIGTTTSKAQD